jgi:hypothetical protein
MTGRADSRVLVLKRSKKNAFFFFLLSAAFVGCGLWLGSRGQMIGWVAAAVFSLGLVVFPLIMLPNALCLILSPEGMEIRGLIRSSSLIRWADIDWFFTGRIGLTTWVVMNFSPDYDRAKAARSVMSTVAGYEGSLPDNFGMKAEELAALLNEWKETYG